MTEILERCAGLDVHQATVVATVRSPGDAGGRTVTTETFGTTTTALLVLREWLQALGVTHVALESTGVYWKPVYYVLEDGFTLLLINMQHLQHVPGGNPTCAIASGSRSCWNAACCAPVWCRPSLSVICAV